MKKKFILIVYFFLITFAKGAEINVQIMSVSGEVKIRYGLEESWHKANNGVILKNIDTILTGENSETVLKINDQKTFILGSNAILDIAELRNIQEKELFLYLMSKKVEQIEAPDKKTRLRIGNVSVVHGSLNQKTDSTGIDSMQAKEWSVREKNGALALQLQKYYTNSIMKLHKVIDNYGYYINNGEIYFYIGHGFEAINQTGQAIDAYIKSRDYYAQKIDSTAKQKVIEINNLLEKLKN